MHQINHEAILHVSSAPSKCYRQYDHTAVSTLRLKALAVLYFTSQYCIVFQATNPQIVQTRTCKIKGNYKLALMYTMMTFLLLINVIVKYKHVVYIYSWKMVLVTGEIIVCRLFSF